MAKYQQYAEYKDSGVEWLGEIPSHWEVIKCSNIFSTTKGENAAQLTNEYCASQESIYPVFSGKTENNGLMGMIDTFEFDYSNSGCILSTTVGAKAMTVKYLAGKFSLSQNCMIIFPRENQKYNAKFYFYFFQPLFSFFRNQIPDYMQPSFRMEDFASYRAVGLDVIEQTQIANFLNHETAQIDTLIDKQQTLIQLLKEKRQAVISHAVTKGLNPDAPMKDSGVEWLGEVPEHWEVTALRRVISRMEQGKSPQCESSPAKLDEWGVLKTSCVNGGRFHEEENKLLPSHIDPHEEYEVQDGDLLMSRASGSINLIGSVVLVQDNVRAKLLLSDKVFRIYLNKDYDSLFFAYLMSSSYMRSSIEIAISGAEGMANNIAKSAIMEFIIPILPIDEQVEIASYIKAIESKYSSLISKAEQAIQLMQERRTALISAAVTGKIDVRGWQAAGVN